MRLIDADALERVILDNSYLIVHDGTSVEQGMSCHGIMQAIAEAPTIEPDGDLISRQDAITSIKEEYFPSVDDYGEGYNEALNKAIWILEKWLPSAETPTVSEKHQLSEETPTNTPTDLISRQDAIRKCCGEKCGCEREDCGYTECCLEVSRLESLPSAPDSRQRGEWTNAGVLTVHCSSCKSEFHELEAMNYCPNCGADMRGGEDE